MVSTLRLRVRTARPDDTDGPVRLTPATPVPLEGVLSPAECGEIRGYVGGRECVEFVRHPDPDAPPVHRLAAELIAEANRQVWRLPELVCTSSPVLRYTPGVVLDWHRDGDLDPERPWVGLIVAVSSDPDDYEGGELQIGWDGTPAKLEQGCGVILPGHVPHRVLKVTAGERLVVAGFAMAPRGAVKALT